MSQGNPSARSTARTTPAGSPGLDRENQAAVAGAPTETVDGRSASPSARPDEGVEWPEYLGEVEPRSFLLSLLASLAAPGLGYVYHGRFLLGVAVNVAYLAALSAFVVLWALGKFFVLWPGAVLLVAWWAMVGLIVLDLRERCRSAQPYVLKPTNHVVVYASVLLFTFWVPLGLTLNWAFEKVWHSTWTRSDGMFPTVLDGDLLLVDRTAYLGRSPGRGELVLVEEPGGSSVYFARVVAIAPDRVHMEGTLPWVNGQQLAQRFRGGLEDLPDPPSPQADARRTTLQLVVESPAGINLDGEDEPPMWYVIAVPTRPVPEPTEPVQLEEGELFVLADNRALPFAPIGARHGGRVVDRDWVVGRPLYVLFSLGPDNAIRWHRIGLRLR